MAQNSLVLVYLVYGLAFFSMGLAILLESRPDTDLRLELALRPLAGFGFIHGINEWVEMLIIGGWFPNIHEESIYALRIFLLTLSFLSLSAFGFSLLSPNLKVRRLSFLAPLIQAAIWSYGLMILQTHYPSGITLWKVLDAWTRYTLGIPSAVIASVGLIVLQRNFRRKHLSEFGRDSLVAAVAFAWYGLVGQLFISQSQLLPSTFLNQELFFAWFGVPIQLVRAISAVVITIFVIRLMRSFDEEIKKQLSELQRMRLKEAERKEALRGGLLRQIVNAQEAERQRIARELHDDTGQTLTALGLGLRSVAQAISKNPEQAAQNVAKLEILTAKSLEELSRLIRNLRPSHLDDLGLSATLRWFIGDMKNHTDINFLFKVEGEEYPLPDPINIAIYRIIQEGVTNVIKHAQASELNLILCYKDAAIDLFIEDNGIGINLANLYNDDRQSWGLLGMQERAELLNGSFQIDSSPKKGLSIYVSIPYQTLSNGEK